MTQTIAGEPLLDIDAIDTYYGAMQVHFGLRLAVGVGEIVCLLGGNASGKSTTMKVILGLVRPRAGRVRFAGADITGWETPRVIARGLGSVPEARRIFPAMTVRENLLMGAYLRQDRAAVSEDLERILDLFPRLRERLSQRGGVLSGGEQQMLA
ncbi:MAG TPA: ATP-binding cassette domain-containing protein, partial [Anaerolineales bacterium]|nr:ATP-binding cassette domain-containing protein [Anaerolineales bacterium]